MRQSFKVLGEPDERPEKKGERPTHADISLADRQVVCPPSINRKTGRSYTIYNPAPVAFINIEKELLPALRKACEGKNWVVTADEQRNNGQVTDVIGDYSEIYKPHAKLFKKRSGKRLVGSHAFGAPSKSGKSFVADMSTGKWYCNKCKCGGGHYAFQVMMLNQLPCKEAVEATKKLWEERSRG